MRITNWKFEPTRIGLRADDDEFLHLIIFRHSRILSHERKVQVDRRGGSEFERLQNFKSTLRATFEHEPTPARDLSLTDARPSTAEIRASEINEIADRRRLRTKIRNPPADNKRASAMDDDMKSALEQIGMLF